MSGAPQPQLVRGLGLVQASSIVVGTMIGTAIFLVPATMAAATHSLGLVFAAWVLGGLLSLAGALTYAELGAALPEAGGEYVYLRRAYGPVWGFLYGWMQSVIGKPGSIATIATAFALFLSFFFPALPEHWVRIPLGAWTYQLTGLQVVSLTVIVTLTVINYLGVILGGAVQAVMTVLKVAVVGAIVVCGFTLGGGSWTNFQGFFSTPRGWEGLGAFFGVALVEALWGYDGWNNVNMVAGEVRNPERNVPRALIYGTAGVGLIYLAANAAYFYVLPLAQAMQSERIASAVAETFLGRWGAAAVTVGALISTFATLNGSILSGARVPYAMARDALFFRVAAPVHPRHRTPAGAIILQTVFACALILAFGSYRDAYNRLLAYVIFSLWLFYALTTASVFALRRREPHLPRPYRTLGYPWAPAIFVGLAGVLCAGTIIQRPLQSALGLGLILAGLPFYFYWQRRLRRQS